MASIHRLITSLIIALTATRPGRWLFAKLAHRLDRFVVHSSQGKHTLAELLTGLPVAMLTTTGAKSGLPRSVPVMVIFDGDLPALISSNWGQSKHPGWYYNLLANPRAELQLNSHKQGYLAREVQGEEREKFWALAVSRYPGYETYKQRARPRQIAVWVLEPDE
jgi:deazaflavin-dependent oxidoreductase (nitroreductase family)